MSAVVKGKSEYVLFEEQLIVYDRVLHATTSGISSKKKTILIVRGGPGTGKSVIAMNLLGDLSGKGLNTHYVTGSRPFTTTVAQRNCASKSLLKNGAAVLTRKRPDI